MGVKQLKKLLTKYAPSSIMKRDIEYYKGKKFAIDANLFMYRFYYNHGNYIDGFTNQVFYFLKNIYPQYSIPQRIYFYYKVILQEVLLSKKTAELRYL